MSNRIQVEFKPGDTKLYTYEIPEGVGEFNVQVGGWVRIPKTGFEKGFDPYEDWVYVRALGSDYDGPCKQIIGCSPVHPSELEPA